MNLSREATLNDISELYDEMYKNEPFIRLLDSPSLPATQQVRGSNYCDISVNLDERTGRLIIVSAIDNIVKGASGQAVQNMNLMYGFAEDAGLQHVPLFP